MEQKRYPIGRFLFEGMTAAQQEQWIVEVEQFPHLIREAAVGLNDEQLNTPYRHGGWTVRQTVHHMADASMQCYSRFKWALTESNPTIKPFHEDGWAGLKDSVTAPPEHSLAILDGVHPRWSILLRSMGRADFEKQFYHPEQGIQIKLSAFLSFVAWHGKHHAAHIRNLREERGW